MFSTEHHNKEYCAMKKKNHRTQKKEVILLKKHKQPGNPTFLTRYVWSQFCIDLSYSLYFVLSRSLQLKMMIQKQKGPFSLVFSLLASKPNVEHIGRLLIYQWLNESKNSSFSSVTFNKHITPSTIFNNQCATFSCPYILTF